MYLKPSENEHLIGMKHFFNEIINLYNHNKMPNKILISGKKGLGKSTLAYHVINFILSQDEEFKYDSSKNYINKKNKSYKLVQNSSHPNFYLIDLLEEKKIIDITQIRQMITYTNKSCFNLLPRFILIDNIENLNKNSVNSLLKIIEEPNEGIFFILINNNEKKILPTLKSRCLTFKINFTFKQSVSVANKLLNMNVLNDINNDIINHYVTPGDIINLVNFAKDKKIDLYKNDLVSLLNLIIDNNYYKKNRLIKRLLTGMIEHFFLKSFMLTNTKRSFFKFYHQFLHKINDMEKFNLDDETLYLEFKSKLLHE